MVSWGFNLFLSKKPGNQKSCAAKLSNSNCFALSEVRVFPLCLSVPLGLP